MKFEIEVTDEQIDKICSDVLHNLPECCYSFRCVRWKYEPEWNFTFHGVEEDEGKTFTLTWGKAREAVIATIKRYLDKGHYTVSQLLTDPDWDAPMIDEVIQQALLGEVIYG